MAGDDRLRKVELGEGRVARHDGPFERHDPQQFEGGLLFVGLRGNLQSADRAGEMRGVSRRETDAGKVGVGGAAEPFAVDVRPAGRSAAGDFDVAELEIGVGVLAGGNPAVQESLEGVAVDFVAKQVVPTGLRRRFAAAKAESPGDARAILAELGEGGPTPRAGECRRGLQGKANALFFAVIGELAEAFAYAKPASTAASINSEHLSRKGLAASQQKHAGWVHVPEGEVGEMLGGGGGQGGRDGGFPP